MSNRFSPNDILLDQTMLCEASRLLERCPEGEPFVNYPPLSKSNESSVSRLNRLYERERRAWLPGNPERLFNLSMLLDGLALHEHIYILQAELPPDADQLPFRQLLLEKNIVRELPTGPYHQKIREEFDVFFSRLSFPKNSIQRQFTTRQILQAIDDFLAAELNKEGRKSPLFEGLRKEYEGDLEHRRLGNGLHIQPLPTIGEYILDGVSYLSSGLVSGISFLRTLIYWRISEHAGLPFYPSSRRIPQFDAVDIKMPLAETERLYQIIADAFQEDIQFVYEQPIPLFLPPSLSIFLDLYRSSYDLSRAIDAFRREFSGVRQDFSSLEKRLASAETLREKRELRHQLRTLAKSLQAQYQQNDDSDSGLETVINFMPELVNLLINPLDPSKYSEKLVTKPVRWIQDWWRKRPLRHVFHLQDRLGQIARYEQLASEVLGVHFDERANGDFRRHYDAYLALYRSQAGVSDQ